MKKSLSLLALIAATGLAAAPAQAANPYVSAMGGISWMNTMHFAEQPYNITGSGSYAGSDVKLNHSANFLGAVGCKTGNTRVEAEIGYQKHDLASAIDLNGPANTPSSSYVMKGTLSVTSLLANAYYDIDLGDKVQCYATAGAGSAWISMRNVDEPGNNGYNLDASVFAWQLGAGLTAPVSDKIKIDLRYRYFATQDFTADYHSNYFANDSSTAHISTHSILLGLRVDI